MEQKRMSCINNSSSLRRIFRLGGCLFCNRPVNYGINSIVRRTLLSESYACTEAWKSRLLSPALQNVGDYMNFTMALREQTEKTGKASPIDIDILANKLTSIEGGQTEYVAELLRKFRHSPEGLNMLASTPYAVVRGYIDLSQTDQLLKILKDKHGYGIFPDNYSTCILLDHCIKRGAYGEGAKMAYELMIQEDFSHALSRLLSLYTCVYHAQEFPVQPDDTAEPTEAKGDQEEEEIDWIPVRWIRTPFYDDHFDIENEQFLLGKTLVMIGRSQPDLIGRSCQLMGLGLYEKFSLGLDLMEQFLTMSESVAKQTLMKFEKTLETSQTRDPDAPEKELGLQGVADEIHLLKPTPEEKTDYIQRFKELSSRLEESGLSEDVSLEQLVSDYVNSEIKQYEQADIDAQLTLFKQWTEQREGLLQAQVAAIIKEQKLQEIMEKLKELQHKEEMLKYFEKQDEIVMAKWKAPKEVEEKIREEDEDPEVLRQKRIKRRQFRKNI